MSVWNTLKFKAVVPVVATAAALRWAARMAESPTLEYRNQRPKSILVPMAKRIALQWTAKETAKLASSWIDAAAEKYLQRNKDRVEQQYQNGAVEEIIKNRVAASSNEGYGTLDLPDAYCTVRALDHLGELVEEAMILYYDDPCDELEFNLDVYKRVDGAFNAQQTSSYKTKRWFHIDLAPEVSVSSSKNIVFSQVQGRDCTRKELVSGGDVHFSVKGQIVSDKPGAYPTEGVRKFVKIMQHNGILNVKSFQFNQLGVKRIIVQDFSLGTIDCFNAQPYSFSCVAIEPDEEIAKVVDTVSLVNQSISTAEATRNLDLVAILKQKAVEIATDSTVYGVGLVLDEMTSHI